MPRPPGTQTVGPPDAASRPTRDRAAADRDATVPPTGPADRDAGRAADRDADRVVSPLADADDRVIETALRPKRLADFVGQQRVRDQLSLVLESAVRRGRPPDHVLLSGPPGLGKTTIAMIIAAELGMPMRITSGPAIERSGDLAAVLSTLTEGEVVFIDEIHRLARPAEEMLYLAMEDFRVDVVVGKGPGATAIPLDIAPFTLVGATTRSGLLPAPLRDRFGFTAHMDFYQPAELEIIIRRSAGLLGVTLRDDGAAELAGRSRGTPRIANRLLRRVRDYAEVKGNGVVDRAVARAALELYEVDEQGLDRLDRAVLDALIHRYGGGPVGLSTLAVAGRARRPRRWRSWPSRSWSAAACWRAHRAAGSPPPPRGSTSASRLPRETPAPAASRDPGWQPCSTSAKSFLGAHRHIPERADAKTRSP